MSATYSVSHLGVPVVIHSNCTGNGVHQPNNSLRREAYGLRFTESSPRNLREYQFLPGFFEGLTQPLRTLGLLRSVHRQLVRHPLQR